MKKWQWILLAVLAYLLFFISYTPAAFVAGYVHQFSDNKALLSGVSGTLFSGKAESLSVQGVRVNQLNWELSPWSLLLLRANLDIKGGNLRKTDDVYVKGNVSTSLLKPQNIHVQNASIFVPTKTLLSQIKLPVFVTASGRFRVDIDQLEMDNGCAVLDGKGNWLDAAISVNKKDIDFGTFDANLSCNTPAFSLQILPDNKLSLDANVNVSLSGKYNVNGQYRVTPDLPKEIRDAAGFFGKPQGGGVYTIDF